MRGHHPGYPSAPDRDRVSAVDRTRPLLCFVHSITDAHSGVDLIRRGRGGWGALDIVQVRGKDLPAGDLERLVESWLGAIAAHDTVVVVNDRLDVALATGADGVHAGRDDLPPAEIRRLAGSEVVVGASAHDRRELLEAQESGATYAGLGAFFPSRTKPDAILLDVSRAGLDDPVEGLAIPVVAIGGITAERVRDAFRVPAVTGLAVSEAIQGSNDPADAVTRLRAAVDRTWKERAQDTEQGN